MNLNEIIILNQKYEIDSKLLQDRLLSLKNSIKNINNTIDLNEFRQLSYAKAKEIHRLIYNHSDFELNEKLYAILNQIKESEYPILKQAHYYPVINEMDFLDNKQKKDLDKYLKGMYTKYIYTESSAWYNMNFKKEIEDKIFSFLHDKRIIEKAYRISCGCGSSECTDEIITQEKYDNFIKYHSITDEDKSKMSHDDLTLYHTDWSDKGYIEVGCWGDGYKEIYDIDTFLKEIRLFAYKNITKPDLSLDEI